ncbi:hypothetical protein ACFPM3_22485 [Streptomyces coeruleoprunus]|uniref:Ricin B lectin domain-containing protein n=1 Tax=Streptomyces coeruleoprunus TaxID=285563 RepID=A0ABV9XHT4_9ACTN
MSQLLPNGVYVIRNAHFEDRVIDLSQGRPEPNTPVIGWHLHRGANQQWELTSLNGVNLYSLKSMISAGDSFLALSDLRVSPPLLAGQPYYEQWSIEPVGEGLFRIHHPYHPSVATLSEEKEGTQMTLLPWEGDQRQMWRFEAV